MFRRSNGPNLMIDVELLFSVLVGLDKNILRERERESKYQSIRDREIDRSGVYDRDYSRQRERE